METSSFTGEQRHGFLVRGPNGERLKRAVILKYINGVLDCETYISCNENEPWFTLASFPSRQWIKCPACGFNQLRASNEGCGSCERLKAGIDRGVD